MKNIRKIAAIALAGVMAAGMISGSAFAAGDTSEVNGSHGAGW